jgi:UDP:flavonoid glycosyltransferase YjiC (YdhE family)
VAVPVQRRFLIVTWQAGGGVHPALGLGKRLARRGHEVRVLAPRILRERVEAAGCVWRAFPAAAEFDPDAGRAAEDQREYIAGTFFGGELPAALANEVEASRPDALVVDAMLASTVCSAEALGLPVAALVHTLRAFHGDFDTFGTWGFEEVNELRATFGLDLIPVGRDTVFVELQRRCQVELVALPAELDLRRAPQQNVVHVGPLFEDDIDGPAFELPWAPDDSTPLVVVGLSSQYMHQEALFSRILTALADLPVHVLATSGLELDPDELRVRANVELRRYVPHGAVLPRAALLVTHAGTGSLLAGFAHGVPCVCIPLGRDQPRNAALAAELGAALALPADAEPAAIRAAVVEALGSHALRREAGRLRDAIAAYGDGAIAIAMLEQLAAPATA